MASAGPSVSLRNRGKGNLLSSWLGQDWFRSGSTGMSIWFGGCMGWPAPASGIYSSEEVGQTQEDTRDPRREESERARHQCGTSLSSSAVTAGPSAADVPADRLCIASALHWVPMEQQQELPSRKSSRKSTSDSFSPTFSHTFSQENPGDLNSFYDLKKRMGEGAFGTVRKAVCKASGLERAVKTVSVKSVKQLANFEREICVAKSLDHPNIARLYETFRDSKHIHLVIELCTGGELFDRIVGSEGLGELQSGIYIRQILEGICYLHAHCLVHRDVKPENFLLQNSAPGAALKMIDFGLARFFTPGENMSTRVGTAYYVAPQVLRGSYDEKCDIWSAGVILYILLSGYPPFYGDNDEAIFRQIKRGRFDFPSPDWDGISLEAKALVTQLLANNSARRLTAELALTSPFLTHKATQEPADPAEPIDFVASLKSFKEFNTLKKLSLTAVAQQLPDEETASPRKLFRSLDKNGDGMISAQEIRESMMEQGMKVPLEMEDLVRAVDSDGSGKLDYSEFVAATMDKNVCSKRDVCRAAFRIFDMDGDGKITRDELQRALGDSPMARPEEPEQLYKLIGEGDSNGDGCIDFEEFCAMIAPDNGSKKQQQVWEPPRSSGAVLLGREGRTSVRYVQAAALAPVHPAALPLRSVALPPSLAHSTR